MHMREKLTFVGALVGEDDGLAVGFVVVGLELGAWLGLDEGVWCNEV